MGIMAGLALKALGFGKMLFECIWATIRGIFKFAIEKPFQFLTIVLAIALIWVGCYGVNTKNELVETRKIVEEKVLFIKGQDKILKQYVTALEVEKKNHVSDIQRNNQAVSSIKKAADQALARAQEEGRKVAAKRQQYGDLAEKYGSPGTSEGTAEQRLDREQKTNDAFLKDWKKAK